MDTSNRIKLKKSDADIYTILSSPVFIPPPPPDGNKPISPTPPTYNQEIRIDIDEDDNDETNSGTKHDDETITPADKSTPNVNEVLKDISNTSSGRKRQCLSRHSSYITPSKKMI